MCEPGARAGVLRTAVVACVLERDLIALQRLARRAVGVCVLLLAAFADPAGEFVRIEMGIAAIGDGREGTVLEREQGGVGAFGRSRSVPGTGLGAHALQAAAAQQPDDVHVMR